MYLISFELQFEYSVLYCRRSQKTDRRARGILNQFLTIKQPSKQ